jgi:peroxiredoxin
MDVVGLAAFARWADPRRAVAQQTDIGMKGKRNMRRKFFGITAMLLAMTAVASDPAVVTGSPAPGFELQDPSGKTIQLKDYRGKVVLVDFWATWCTGCKEEIPWFVQFQETYGKKGYATVGVSMDDGWSVLKPFLADHPIPYTVVLGNEAIAKLYGIEGMPDTFLIDRHGKIAAAYLARKVNKDEVEAKIKTLLAQR